MFKKQYEVYLGNSTVNIRKDGKDFFSLSAAVSVNGKSSCLCLHECKDDKIIFDSNNEKMTFYLFEDCIVVEYTKDFGVATPIYDVTAFVDGGMRVNDFDRAFCPQPHGNGVHNMTYYDRLPDISAYGYNSPSMLEFALGNAYGWVSVGLLDLPNTKECKMLDDFSFLIERIGGNNQSIGKLRCNGKSLSYCKLFNSAKRIFTDKSLIRVARYDLKIKTDLTPKLSEKLASARRF